MNKEVTRRINIYLNDKELKHSIYNVNKEYKKQLAIFKRLEKNHPDYKKQAELVGGLKHKLDGMNASQREYLQGITKAKKQTSKFGAGLKLAGKAAIAAFAVGLIIEWGKVLGERIMELRELKHEIKQITGLEGFNLSIATAKAKALADTYKVEASESAKAVNVLMKNFDISAAKSFDLLNKGFLTGANASGNFLEQIREYSPLMKEANLKADEFVGLMVEAEKRGIWSDKGIDAIKEGFLSLREGTKATKDALKGLGFDVSDFYKRIENGSLSYFEAMKLVSKKIDETGNKSKKTGTALADIFKGAGEDAGFEFVSQLHNASSNLDELISKSDEYIKLKQEEFEVNEKLNGAIEEMTVVGGVWQSVLISLKDYTADFLNGLTDLYGFIKKFGFWEYMKTWDVEPFNKIINSFRVLKKEIAESEEPLKKIARSLADLKSQLNKLPVGSKESVYLKEQIKELTDMQAEYMAARMKKAKEANKKIQEETNKNNKKISLNEQKELTKRLNAIKQQQQKLIDIKIAGLDEGFEKEKKTLDNDFNKRISKLKQQLNTEEVIRKTGSVKLKQAMLQQNDLLNEEILLAEDLHLVKHETLIDKWIAKNIAKAERMQIDFPEETETEEDIDVGVAKRKVDLTGIDYDILGFTPDQWQNAFDKLEEGENRFENFTDKVSMGLQALTTGWGMYYDSLNKQDSVRFDKFSKNQDKQRDSLRDSLDKGLISQQNYDKQVKKLDLDMEKEKAMLDYNRAKREKTMGLLQIGTSTATAIMKAVALSPATGGLPWSAIIAGIGAAQALAVSSIDLPSKGYYYGGFTGNNAMYNDKYGGVTGVVHDNEYVVPTVELQDPQVASVVNGLEAKRSGEVDALRFGNSNQDNSEIIQSINTMNNLLNELIKNGVSSSIAWGYKDTHELIKKQKQLNRIRNNG